MFQSVQNIVRISEKFNDSRFSFIIIQWMPIGLERRGRLQVSKFLTGWRLLFKLETILSQYLLGSGLLLILSYPFFAIILVKHTLDLAILSWKAFIFFFQPNLFPLLSCILSITFDCSAGNFLECIACVI